jgi:hypothetical protein
MREMLETCQRGGCSNHAAYRIWKPGRVVLECEPHGSTYIAAFAPKKWEAIKPPQFKS